MAKILVAEDDPHMLRLLSMWLTRNGHQVTEVVDGQAAQEVLIATDVDLIVTDFNMPRMTGAELVHWVRAQKSASVPIVMLSSRCDQGDISAELKPLDVRVHPKPFSPSRLVVEIEQMLATAATV